VNRAGYEAVAGALRRLVDVAAEGARVLDAPMVMYGPDGEPFEPDWSGALSRRESVGVLVEVGVWHRGLQGAADAAAAAGTS
jgi:hypothetical protein